MHPILEANAEAEAGRRLGYDLYTHRGHFDADDMPPSVVEGYEEASARRPARHISDRFHRKWLQLRMQALRRGRAYDEQVTPDLIRRLDVVHCPITREPLTHGERADSDWSLDRLNNDGGYAPNNLAVMSVRANKAKGGRSFEEVLRAANGDRNVDGLEAVEWLRMAAMMLGPCFAHRPAEAPMLPHPVPVTSHRLLLASQQVQHVFCAGAKAAAGKNALIKAFRCASPHQRGEMRLRSLAEKVHVGLKRVEHPCDVWLDDETMSALAHWREALDEPAWALAGEISRQLAGGRRVEAQRLQAWHMATRGYSSGPRAQATTH